MLTPCSATPKFVDVELCDEVQIDALVLANFEFFSSTFKHFKASCSVDYPGKPDDWHDLGTFRARNVRGVQVFRPLSNPPFCRYVRIDFLSHFGSEYYCPVSLLRVYGYTQLESFRESERKAKALEDALAAAELGEGEAEGDEDGAERALEGALEVEVDKVERVDERDVAVVVSSVESSEQGQTSSEAPVVTSAAAAAGSSSAPPTPSPSSTAPSTSPSPPLEDEPPFTLSDAPSISFEAAHTSSAPPAPSTSSSLEGSSTSNSSSASSTSVAITAVETSSGLTASAEPGAHSTASTTDSVATTSSASPADSSRAPASSPTTTSPSPPSSSSLVPPLSTAVTHTATGRPATGSDHPVASPRPPPLPSSSSSSTASRNDTHASYASPPHHPASATHVPRAPLPVPPPPPPPPAVAQPQPGESIYGTIMKRLASLEHNQTLAMGFIEAQSGMLREAFGRVERRLGDVEGSRSRQEQSLRQSLLELEKQRVDLERERLALASQINLLSQEIRFEKHLTLAQLVGLLLVVIFVGFTRGIPTSPFLHLASTTSTARASKRKAEALGVTASSREKDWEEQRGQETEGDKAEPVTSEAPRRTHRVSPSASLSRHSSAKRYPSISKPGALRRHYGPMTGSSSSSSKAMSRSWTPPVRHSSAPPEDVLDPSGNLVDATRRRLVPRATGSGLGASRAYEFPMRSPGGSGTTSPARGATAQPPPALALPLPSPSSHLTPQALESIRTRDLTPSSADEADGEQVEPRAAAAAAEPAGLGRTGLPFPLETIPSFDGYSTYSSEDEAAPLAPHRRVAPPVPAVPSASADRLDKGKGRAPVPSPSSSSAASGSSPGARPPKPHVPPRPATALGIRLPSKQETSDAAQQDGDELRGFAVQVPRSALPSPPPEPVPLPRRVSGTHGSGKDDE
ncbi:uncharacterized protein RHOBADRAFT_50230 [Rhodotorula graminis WP1]|uniref:SUN domain-containing protein n=1 Tax=Rhodotorula graminis (strain WP1) TaxID=578459 RepID=A0A0P9EL98_RHOGW|nr:uncharacterized protein RHOBADRAFT_50230 [Rhodotorula graminis WP1]KPV72500.1 hypothetical protein RHOBADRAFT_50230 [Rhodotorula graminis WP1]